MQSVNKIVRWFAIATAAVCAALLAITAIAAVFAFAVRAIFSEPGLAASLSDTSAKNALVVWAYGGEAKRGPRRPSGQPESELNAAQVNSQAIDNRIFRCTSNLLQKPEINAKVRAQFGQDADHYATTPSNTLTQDAVLPVAADLRFLSTSIVIGRAENAVAVSDSYLALQVATLLAIFLGLVTTVLVSLSSTEFGRGDSQVARIIRILAIVFPALGTATAAVAAFYAPGETHSRASQALAGFRQVHDQIAGDLGALACPSSSEPAAGSELVNKLAVWKKSLRDAQTVKEAAALAATDASRGQLGVGGNGPSDRLRR